MGFFDRLSDEDRAARQELRAEQIRIEKQEADRRAEEARQWERQRQADVDADAEYRRQLDMRDGRYDGRI
jgi:hypothetical protein